MKNYFLLAVLFLSSFGTQAFANLISNDKTYSLDSVNHVSNSHSEEQITLDLILNNWILNENTTVTGVTQHFDFNEIGIVKITTNFADENTLATTKNMIWQVIVEENKPLLILTDINTDSHTIYKINQTCEGISLNNTLLNKQLNLVVYK